MEKSGAEAYVYAKACGMYARSYVGPRTSRLFAVKRLQDLWSLLYRGSSPCPKGCSPCCSSASPNSRP